MIRKFWSSSVLPKFLYRSECRVGATLRNPNFTQTAYKSNETTDHEDEYQRCKRIIDAVFGPNSYQESKEKIREDQASDISTTIVSSTNTKQTTKGGFVFYETQNLQNSIPFDDKYNKSTSKDDFEVQKIDKHIQMATTNKTNEEKLQQKIEKINETPLVEAPKPDVEGFNTNPRVLGNAPDQEYLGNIEKFKRNEADRQGQAGLLSQNEIDLDKLAESCMGLTNEEIDKKILAEMDRLGVQPIGYKRDPNEIVNDIEGSSILQQSDAAEYSTVKYDSPDVSGIDKKAESDFKNHYNLNSTDDDSIASSHEYNPEKCGNRMDAYTYDNLPLYPLNQFYGNPHKDTSHKGLTTSAENEQNVVQMNLGNSNFPQHNVPRPQLTRDPLNVIVDASEEQNDFLSLEAENLKYNYHYNSAWGAYQYDCRNKFNQAIPSSIFDQPSDKIKEEEVYDESYTHATLYLTNSLLPLKPTCEDDAHVSVVNTVKTNKPVSSSSLEPVIKGFVRVQDLESLNLGIHSKQVSNVSSMDLFKPVANLSGGELCEQKNPSASSKLGVEDDRTIVRKFKPAKDKPVVELAIEACDLDSSLDVHNEVCNVSAVNLFMPLYAYGKGEIGEDWPCDDEFVAAMKDASAYEPIRGLDLTPLDVHSEVSNVSTVNLFMPLSSHSKRHIHEPTGSKSPEKDKPKNLRGGEAFPIAAHDESEPVFGGETSKLQNKAKKAGKKGKDISKFSVVTTLKVPVPAENSNSECLPDNLGTACKPYKPIATDYKHEMKLSEMLKRVRECNRMVYSENPVCQKKYEMPPCPPPTPKCPPPTKCPPPSPPPCPPPPPPCPRPPPVCPPPPACPPPPPNPCCPPPPPPPCPPPCPPPPPVCPPPPPACPPKKCQTSATLHDIDGPFIPLLRRPIFFSVPEALDEIFCKGVLSIENLISDLKYSLSPHLYGYGTDSALLFKDYEPWTPIPSWKIPPKEKKKPACPKERCKKFPPAVHECKPKSCTSFPRRFKDEFTENKHNNLYTE